jgi:prevent-host-death family protein
MEVYASGVHMAKSVSIVEARRDLGRLADEVCRTGQAVVLTRRGRPVARLASHPPSSAEPDRPKRPLADLQGSVRLLCARDEILRAVRELRREFTASIEHRGSRLQRSPRRRGG